MEKEEKGEVEMYGLQQAKRERELIRNCVCLMAKYRLRIIRCTRGNERWKGQR